MSSRVVITGLGAITPLGHTAEELWRGLLEGRSGVGPLTRFDPEGFSSQIAAEVHGFDPTDYVDRREARKMDLFCQYGMAAGLQAAQRAGLKNGSVVRERLGIILGTGIGGIDTLLEQYDVLKEKGPKRVSPYFVPMIIANMAAGMMSIALEAKGPNLTVVTACASGAHAIGEAMRILQRGLADVVLAGGTEAPIIPLTQAGFCSMRALSTRNHEPQKASRPFDAERDGFVIGEGAAMLVLELEEHALRRGVEPLAEVMGYGCTADAHHITAPAPGGEGGARAMAEALLDAGVSASEVDYINAHGTSTPVGDVGETQAIKQVFGEHAYRVPVSSSKSMIGHMLGAAGAAEAVATVMSLRDQLIHPTINLENPDPDCDLDYVSEGTRSAHIRVAVSNSFGFGGQNASLVLGRWSENR